MFVILFGLIVLNLPTHTSAQTVQKTPIPAWVEDVQIPVEEAGRDDRHKNGLAWLLDDIQYDWDGETRVAYYHSALKILSRQGLEAAATLEANFDPETQDWALHRVIIHRDGATLDVTEEIKLEVLRREEDLDNGILDGELTVHANIAGVQVGDIVEISRSWTDSRPFFENSLSLTDHLNYTFPVVDSRIKLRVPAGTEMKYAVHGSNRSPDILRTGTHDVYVWQERNVSPVPSEENRPSEFPLFSYLEVSSWEDWNAVRDALLDSYHIQETLPPSYSPKVDDIRSKYTSQPLQMSEALQLVQNDIRYVGIEIGAGGYVPRQPAIVVERGYGDCKDKALLLTAILRDLGIGADVALVNSNAGYGLPDRLPSPFRFDHAIVRAEIGDETFWLDPTWTHRGGRGKKIVQPDYGYALVLSEGANGLERMAPWQPGGPEVKISEDYRLPANPDQPVRFEVKTVFTDREADYMRQSLAQSGKADLARRYASYYAERYPGMRPSEDLRIVDNFELNEIRIYESYQLKLEDFSKGNMLTDFRIRADAVLDKLPSPSGYQRKAPLKLDGPISYEHDIYIFDPLRGFAALEEINIDNDAFSYHRTTPRTGPILWIRWQLDIKRRSIAVDQIENYLTDERKAADESYLVYDFSKYFSDLTAKAEVTQETVEVSPELEENLGLFLIGLMFVAFAAYVVFALRHGLIADREYRDVAVYFPVSAFKFLGMTVVTLGLYPLFWSLKFWFWSRNYEQAGIWPVWRSLFAYFWLFPAFRRANNRLSEREKRPLPVWLGAFSAAFCLILQLSSTALSGIETFPADIAAYVAIPLLTGLCFLPAVFAVNRNNRLMHVEYNSRWSFWNISAVFLYSVMLGLTAAGQFAP
ncbi:DUF3857 domain-containing transglutaminase family protein [Roseibium sp. M-1]